MEFTPFQFNFNLITDIDLMEFQMSKLYTVSSVVVANFYVTTDINSMFL